MSPGGSCLRSPAEVRAAHELKDVLRSLVVREPIDRLHPIFSRTIDTMISPECLRALELCVVAGDNNRPRPVSLGDLQAEQRDTTRAFYEDCLARMQVASFHESEPGSQSGAGQGAGLCMVQ